MIVKTKCLCCGRPIEMDVDQTGLENPVIDATKWLANTNCTRCSAYKTKRHEVVGRIIGTCTFLDMVRKSKNYKPAEKRQLETSITNKLHYQTHEFCAIVCDFKYLQTVWDVEFVNLLMEHPMRAGGIIRDYASRLELMARNVQTEL